ncbi:unnamed protein product [Blepharisma stoltei]|uniref:Uncharacterized protein n=1 Tax=Blepharisma stoltei TaxID=1481888 RepID=A0AAU9JVB3_9CILI|nr:unnamed protein product [Blepharisma stoltei]
MVYSLRNMNITMDVWLIWETEKGQLFKLGLVLEHWFKIQTVIKWYLKKIFEIADFWINTVTTYSSKFKSKWRAKFILDNSYFNSFWILLKLFHSNLLIFYHERHLI